MTNENFKSITNEIKMGDDNNNSLLPSIKGNDLLNDPSGKNINFPIEEEDIGDDKKEFYTYFKNQIFRPDNLNKEKKEENSSNNEFILNDNNFINKDIKEIDNNNVNVDDNDDNTINKDISDKKRKIFKINKIRKLGRKRKISAITGKHNKFAKDNVIRKFKALFINNIYLYVNSLFKINNYGKAKHKINIIKKIDPKLVKTISKEDNMVWLNSKLRDFFSQNISKKLLNFENNYNMKLIKRIYEKNEEKKVIEVLEKTIKEMLYIYTNDDDKKICPGFKTLKDDIKKLEHKGEDPAYIEMYSLVVENYETLFYTIKPRRKKENIIK